MSRKMMILLVAGVIAAALLAAKLNAPAYDGGELYLANCSACHGVYGEGDGAASQGLSVALQDLRYIAQRNDGVFPRELTIAFVDGRETRSLHGPADMPAWGDAFSRIEGSDVAAQRRVAKQVTALVNFLERIQITSDQ